MPSLKDATGRPGRRWRHREWTQEQKQALAQLADHHKGLAEHRATEDATPGSAATP